MVPNILVGSRTVVGTTDIEDLAPTLIDEDIANFLASLQKFAFWFAGVRFGFGGGPMTVLAVTFAVALVVDVEGNEADNCFDVDGLSSLKIVNILEIYTQNIITLSLYPTFTAHLYIIKNSWDHESFINFN